MKRKVFLVLVAAAMVLGAGIFGLLQKDDQTASQTAAPQSFQIGHRVGDGQSRLITVNTGETALAVLQKSTSVITTGEGSNAFVTTINGRQAAAGKKEFWALYVNDKLADVGAGTYIVQPNDQIQWKIETY